jgi:hypothetical protein
MALSEFQKNNILSICKSLDLLLVSYTENIPLLKYVEDYSVEILDKLTTTFISEHQNGKLSFGVPLHRKEHTLYHITYGKTNNTLEQFKSFFKIRTGKGVLLC